MNIDAAMLDSAARVSLGSRDPSTKVGAVLTRDGLIEALGFNDLPQNTLRSPDILLNRVRKYARTVHAEANVILIGRNFCWEGTLYSTHPPCSNCAGLIINSGITRVVLPVGLPGYDPVYHESWQWEESKLMFEEARVTLDFA